MSKNKYLYIFKCMLQARCRGGRVLINGQCEDHGYESIDYDNNNDNLQSYFSSDNTGTVTSNDPIQRRFKKREPITINGYAPLNGVYVDYMKEIIKNGGESTYHTVYPSNGYQSNQILEAQFKDRFRDSY